VVVPNLENRFILMTDQIQSILAKRPLDLLNAVTSAKLRASEREEKWSRLSAFLERSGHSAILIRRHENIAWITAGQVEARIGIPVETGAATLLLTRDGHKYYLAANNEAARLDEEEFPGLGYEAIIRPWQQADVLSDIRRLAGPGSIATDTLFPELALTDLTPLRAPLTIGETTRLRWLAQHTAESTADVLMELEPGLTEDEMSAKVASSLIAQGILPTVLLMAVDERIFKYKHAVSRGAVLERYGMLNLCARKWGLAVSMTRFVHFGPPPQQLVDGFAACAQINAELLHASRSGVTSAQLYATAERAYAEAGYKDDMQLHHQGGPIGYVEREWLATPDGQQALTGTQALAWNPSIRGAKVEDTALLENNASEVLTKTPSLPQINTKVEGITYPAADVLIR
jgi:Xaa-Pro dipeptidase